MFQPRSRRSPGLAAMAALHGVLLLAWWLRPAPPPGAWGRADLPARSQEAAPQPPPIVWLLWQGRPAAAPAAPRPASADTRTPEVPARAAPATPARARQPAPGPVRDPQAITLPATANAAEADPSAAPAPAPAAAPPVAAAPAPAPASAAAPLNLSLPRSRPGMAAPPPNPALAPGAGRATGIEARLQRLLGGRGAGGPVTEERLADGSLRLRRGADCVVVRPNRGATLDSFNQSVSPSPRQVDDC